MRWRPARSASSSSSDGRSRADLHFVKDGHHRVSVARAFGGNTIEANVVEVRTRVGADSELRVRDLPLKRHERVFRGRIPLPAGARARIRLSDEWRYAQLATLVEAWGLRASHVPERRTLSSGGIFPLAITVHSLLVALAIVLRLRRRA